jgi:hypothetical protein
VLFYTISHVLSTPNPPESDIFLEILENAGKTGINRLEKSFWHRNRRKWTSPGLQMARDKRYDVYLLFFSRLVFEAKMATIVDKE